MSPLTFNGVAIRDAGEMLSLTDMWKAAGSEEAKRPANWARKKGSPFIETVALAGNMPEGHILRATRGRDGMTSANWQVALAYAKYLSPEFHMWCNTVVRERMEGAHPANLPAEVREEIHRMFDICKMLSHKITEIENSVPALIIQPAF